MNRKLLYEKLESEASQGATLSELDAEIGGGSQLMTDLSEGRRGFTPGRW